MDPTRFRQWCEDSVTNGDFRRAGGNLVCDAPNGIVKFNEKHERMTVEGQASRSHPSDQVRLRRDRVVFMDEHGRRAKDRTAPIEMI